MQKKTTTTMKHRNHEDESSFFCSDLHEFSLQRENKVCECSSWSKRKINECDRVAMCYVWFIFQC